MKSSVEAHSGRRLFVIPADVKGRFTTRRRIIFAILIVFLCALPFIRYQGRPLVFLNVAERSFYFFFWSFNSQEFWLSFFPITGMAFLLFFVTTLWGRVWCGYACPQTVFLEGIYRRIERIIEGPRNTRLRRNAGGMNLDRLWRIVLKHTLFMVVSLLLAHVFLAYFVSLPSLATMVTAPPAQNMEAFIWMAATTLILYGNFAWFREQLCLVICPYGRYQSVLTDTRTINVGYDFKRGEPRGKKSKNAEQELGDCVDCNRCVAVCPTGIDIRNGLQIDCVACAACIDACDEIMVKVGRPTGLIRYDSHNSFEGKETKGRRARIFFYVFMALVGVGAATVAFSSRKAFEAKLLRSGGAPFVVKGDEATNYLSLHVVNKRQRHAKIKVSVIEKKGRDVTIGTPRFELGPMESKQVPIFVRAKIGSPGCRGEVIARTESKQGEVVESALRVRCPRK